MMTIKQVDFEEQEPFVEWLEEERSANSHESVLFVGYNPVSWHVLAGIGPKDAKPEWAYRTLPVPQTRREAEDIWNDMHEEHLCLLFHVDLYVQDMIVAIRQGIWKSIDDTYLAQPRQKFTEITDEEAQNLIDDPRMWSAMCGEVQMFGVSCRIRQVKS